MGTSPAGDVQDTASCLFPVPSLPSPIPTATFILITILTASSRFSQAFAEKAKFKEMVGKLLLEPQALMAKERVPLNFWVGWEGQPLGAPGELYNNDIKEMAMERLYLSSCWSPSAKATLGRNHTTVKGRQGGWRSGHLRHTRWEPDAVPTGPQETLMSDTFPLLPPTPPREGCAPTLPLSIT